MKKWCVTAGNPLGPFARWLPQRSRIPVTSGITCCQIWTKLQQLAQGGIADFDVSDTENESYLDRIVLVGRIVVPEMTSKPMLLFHACAVEGSDETGNSSVMQPGRTDAQTEELAAKFRHDACPKCYLCFPDCEYGFAKQVKANACLPLCLFTCLLACLLVCKGGFSSGSDSSDQTHPIHLIRL